MAKEKPTKVQTPQEFSSKEDLTFLVLVMASWTPGAGHSLAQSREEESAPDNRTPRDNSGSNNLHH